MIFPFTYLQDFNELQQYLLRYEVFLCVGMIVAKDSQNICLRKEMSRILLFLVFQRVNYVCLFNILLGWK